MKQQLEQPQLTKKPDPVKNSILTRFTGDGLKYRECKTIVTAQLSDT